MTKQPSKIAPAVGTAAGAASASAVAKALWASPMQKQPEHVLAVGMVTIEIAEMERHLARLLGRLLSSAVEIGEAVYFTPKAAIPRIDFICNIAPLVLAKNPTKLKDVLAAAQKSKALMGKRHNIIHNRFEVDGPDIKTIRYDKGIPKSEKLPLLKITKLVDEIRELNITLLDLAEYGKSAKRWLDT